MGLTPQYSYRSLDIKVTLGGSGIRMGLEILSLPLLSLVALGRQVI